MTAYAPIEALLKEKGLDQQAAQVIVREAIDRLEARRPWDLNEFGWLNRADGHIYNPHTGEPKVFSFGIPDGWGQAPFHETLAPLKLLAGGRGSGKTAGGVQESLRMVRERPGWPGAMVSPNVPHWNRSTWPEVQRWTPWERVVQHHKTENWILFDNGSQVWYGGIEDPDAWRGPNLNWLWFDEGARKKNDRALLILMATVRVGPDPRVFVTTTPRGLRHWVADFFVKKGLPEEVKDLLREMGFEGELIEWFFADLEDNLPNLDPLFLAKLLARYTGDFKRQEVGGEFVEGGGTLAQRDWFPIVDSAPEKAKKVRFWDLAATEKKAIGDDPDFTVGGRVSLSDRIYYIEHIARDRYGAKELEDTLRRIAAADSAGVKVGFEQEPGASGKLLVEHYRELLRGFRVEGLRSTGDKVTRAMAWLGQAEAGNVKLVRGGWNEDFLAEVEDFPVGSHDDQVDAISGAVALLGGVGPAPACVEIEVAPETYQMEIMRTKWV